MKTRLKSSAQCSVLSLCFLAACAFNAHAQRAVVKVPGTNAITENLNFGSGKILRIEAGATINATGATITGFGSAGAPAFADITGAAADNTSLAAALALKSPLASPTFTGTVTIPSGASISGYATTAAVAAAYQPLDPDLTAIAALTHTTGNVIMSNGTTWISSAPPSTFSAVSVTDTITSFTVSIQPADSTITANRVISPPNADGYIALTDQDTGLLNLTTSTTGFIPAARIASSTITNGMLAGGINLTTKVTGALPVANGGTGAATLTANNVLLGNGTSALQAVAPGSSGNVLTSNGTTWTSAAPAAGGITGTLTSGRVPFATGASAVADDADLTFATDTLTSTKTASTLTTLTAGTNSATPVMAASLINNTASISGTQSASPALVLTGHGYRTGNSTDYTLSARNYLLPVQGSSGNPAASIVWGTNVDGGAYTDVLTITPGVSGISSSLITLTTPSGSGAIVCAGGMYVGNASTNGGICGYWTCTAVTGAFASSNRAYPFSLGGDVVFVGDAANILARRNGTTAQADRIYNTYTSSTVGEWLTLDWKTVSNVARIATEKGSGGGSARDLRIDTDTVIHATFKTNGDVLLNFDELPTSDPVVKGQLWRSGTALQISAGP